MLGMKCLSPFIGMGFTPPEYINFLTHMREPRALDVLSVSSEERGYPIIETPHARLFGQHYKSDQEFVRNYKRRCAKIDWDNLFIKIDLGKAKYSLDDITRWNEMKLPNSVAIYPDEPKFHQVKIHNGVCIKKWSTNGVEMFTRSCQKFDVMEWLNHGIVKRSRIAGLVFSTLITHGIRKSDTLALNDWQ